MEDEGNTNNKGRKQSVHLLHTEMKHSPENSRRQTNPRRIRSIKCLAAGV